MTQQIVQIDAFADRPFTGNPAAVCLLDELKDERWMQQVSLEMNHSETAFLVRRPGGFDLRWFTPLAEVELCGHATLASAHYLWEEAILSRSEAARFHTRSGLLTAVWKDGWIEMDFPAEPERHKTPPRELVEALGVSPIYTGRNRLDDWLVEISSESELRGMSPDLTLLRSVPMRGVMVTACSATKGFDFVSRFFAPAVGIGEDPVTGSAHCCLGPYWQKKLKRSVLSAFQASSRGGIVHVRVAGDRVVLAGRAVTVMRSSLLV
jgi:PhzF family phenazine biosynthesis protein